MVVRRKYFNELSEYLNKTQKTIGKLFDEIGWSEKCCLKQLETTNKRIQNDIHDFKKNDDLAQEFPESCNNMKHSIQIDKHLQMKIIMEAYASNPDLCLGCPLDSICERAVPVSYKDFQLNFTRDERLSLYNYAIEKTGRFEQPELKLLFQCEIEGKPSRKMTLAEIMAFQKKRRTKYRISKNIPYSYSEEIRILINDQMDLLQGQMKNDDHTNKKETSLIKKKLDKEKSPKRTHYKKEKSRSRDRKRKRDDIKSSHDHEQKKKYKSHK